MKLSLIVPAYNEEKNISKCLISLVSQSYPDIEVIVVNNNSKDATESVAKQYVKHVVTETQQGYIHAVRRGVAESGGDIIAFCDADSIYPSTWAREIVLTFEKNPGAVAVYGPCKTHDAGVLNILNGVAYTGFVLTSKLLGLDNTAGFNFAIRKSAYEKVGGYDPNYIKMSPDIELGKRLKKEGKIVLRPDLWVESSFRRFQTGGVVKTGALFLKNWWQMIRGKEPSTSYADYNASAK
jgi:glycosyltransferase involved in cell wall biosynthesis